MFGKIRRSLLTRIDRFLEKRIQSEHQKYSLGLLHAKATRQLISITNLSEVEWQAFSQWGEDGILDWLVEQLPDIPKSFIEFGVEDYKESNTRMLLKLRNWKGLIIDGSTDQIANIRKQDIYWKHSLTARCQFITRENINGIFKEEGFTGEIGLLSIDIDGNDYWVWESIENVNPILIICEYNAVLGDKHAITIPYDADFIRNRAHHSRMYYGASIQALNHLALQKGYTLLGSNSNGSSVFLVRNDFAPHLTGKIKTVRTFPSQFRESRNNQGKLTFINGQARADVIGHLPVTEVVTGRTEALSHFFPLYTDAWKK